MTLTEEQIQALSQGKAVSVVVAETECILIRKDRYQGLQAAPIYDDSDWTDEERSALAGEMFEQLDNPEKIS
jgi:hypothetical protein